MIIKWILDAHVRLKRVFLIRCGFIVLLFRPFLCAAGLLAPQRPPVASVGSSGTQKCGRIVKFNQVRSGNTLVALQNKSMVFCWSTMR